MENKQIDNQFRPDEIVQLKHWDKEAQAYVTRAFPKLSGRLRLAHEDNENISISTEIGNYDGKVAVVVATCTTDKGSFKGIGMSSVERDPRIAPAILEMAESRAIARALRFAGYGLEFCSAEEVSHLENATGQVNGNGRHQGSHSAPAGNGNRQPQGRNGSRNGNAQRNGDPVNGQSNCNRRLSGRQYQYLMSLNEKKGKSREELDQYCLNTFGTATQYLSKIDAQSLITSLLH